jgi:protein-L-isoaspartate O-methyltransferase
MKRTPGDKMRAAAEAFEKKAAAKRTSGIHSQNLTARRARIAAGMAKEAEGLERRATIARRLAELHDLAPFSEVGRVCARITTGAALETVLGWRTMPTGRGWPEKDRARLIKLGIEDDATLAAARDFLLGLEGPAREPTREEKVRELERDLIGARIPGFFPTPEPIGRRMIELANVKPGDRVLEPSAGKGDLVELALAAGARVHAVEINYSLVEVLRARFEGLDVAVEHADYLGRMALAPRLDAVIMNPPFEKGADADHVMAAFADLSPGGVLVAIVSEGLFFREDAKARFFRTFLKNFKGQSVKLERGAFTGAESFRQTGVAARLVRIVKPR